MQGVSQTDIPEISQKCKVIYAARYVIVITIACVHIYIHIYIYIYHKLSQFGVVEGCNFVSQGPNLSVPWASPGTSYPVHCGKGIGNSNSESWDLTR